MAEKIAGILRYPHTYRATLVEPSGTVSWLVDNDPPDSPLGTDDLARAAELCRANGKKDGDSTTVNGVRGTWWSGEPYILIVNDDIQ